MAPKSAPRYIGYVGGVAVAAGIGAAIAVAGQGTAHAESDSDAGARSGAVNATKSDTGAKTAKPLAKLGNDVEKAATQAGKSLTAAVNKATKTLAAPVKPTAGKAEVKKPKPTAQEFEATQVTKLREALTPKKPAVTPTAAAVKPTAAAGPSVAAAAVPGLPDPFRADDPEPNDIPTQVIDIRDSLMAQVGPEYAPYAREGVEAAYRVSQMVPWLNVVIPAVTILDLADAAVAGDKVATQKIANELIKTTQIASLLYYGYDEAADLANVEDGAQAFKVQLFASTWDLLDPTGALHVSGESGL